jgi:ethanolamine utilization protein EutP (predicted NTPase)
MIKVSIKNSQGIVTNQASFASQLMADTWLNDQMKAGVFGKNERWVHEDDLIVLGEDRTKAIASQQVTMDSSGTTKTEFKFAAEYTVEQSDISAELSAQAELAKALYAQQLGSQIVARVFSVNESSSITQAQLLAILADADIALIERLCWNGSLVTARAKIASLPNTFFTAAQIAGVLSLVDSYIEELADFDAKYIANQSNG